MLKTRLNLVLFIYSSNRRIFLFRNYQVSDQRFKSKLEMENWSQLILIACIMLTTKLVHWGIVNHYLGDFGNVRERRFWTKKPELLFWFWWRHTWPFIFMILDYVSNTNYTLPGKITWRHHREISRDWWDYTANSGYWTFWKWSGFFIQKWRQLNSQKLDFWSKIHG